MPERIAIFYDIENLVVGHPVHDQCRITLAPFEEALAEAGVMGPAQRRAYANWADSRLPVGLLGELEAWGSQRVQTGGGYYGAPKNAADIHLMLDAQEIALTRPELETVVLVTGDGDFTSLAVRLRERGKRVVGMAYRGRASQMLEAVCDDFRLVAPPGWEALRRVAIDGDVEPQDSRPILSRLMRETRIVVAACHGDLVNQARRVIEWFAHDPQTARMMADRGLPGKWVLDAMWYTVRGFRPSYLQSGSLSAFMRTACDGTNLAVVDMGDAGVRLVARHG